MVDYDLERIDKIRKLTIISMFTASDYLMKFFALKGGNALNYVYNVNQRSSLDVDISMEGSFEDIGMTMDDIKDTLKSNFEKTFAQHGFEVFDFELEKKPSTMDESQEKFWGGYRVVFKVLQIKKWEELDDIEDKRRQAIPYTLNHRRNFSVDISRHEYCAGKEEKHLDDYLIFVYSPRMIVLEKLRSICQQTKEYAEKIGTHQRRGRAQDFFDIYITINRYDIDLYSSESIEELKEIFKIKRVPLEYLSIIEKDIEFHRDSFQVVQDTVYNPEELRKYEFYFDYVINIADNLSKMLGIK